MKRQQGIIAVSYTHLVFFVPPYHLMQLLSAFSFPLMIYFSTVSYTHLHVVLAVNKMDLVDFDKQIFDKIVADYKAVSYTHLVKQRQFIC